ncbi:hypothetical protein HDV05_001772, partial [Chytridiales sp. JEL 0842]
ANKEKKFFAPVEAAFDEATADYETAKKVYHEAYSNWEKVWLKEFGKTRAKLGEEYDGLLSTLKGNLGDDWLNQLDHSNASKSCRDVFNYLDHIYNNVGSGSQLYELVKRMFSLKKMGNDLESHQTGLGEVQKITAEVQSICDNPEISSRTILNSLLLHNLYNYILEAPHEYSNLKDLVNKGVTAQKEVSQKDLNQAIQSGLQSFHISCASRSSNTTSSSSSTHQSNKGSVSKKAKAAVKSQGKGKPITIEKIGRYSVVKYPNGKITYGGLDTPIPPGWVDPTKIGEKNWEGKYTCTQHDKWVAHAPEQCNSKKRSGKNDGQEKRKSKKVKASSQPPSPSGSSSGSDSDSDRRRSYKFTPYKSTFT